MDESLPIPGKRTLGGEEKIPFDLRYDSCHFGKLAQKIAADELANSISYYHKLK